MEVMLLSQLKVIEETYMFNETAGEGKTLQSFSVPIFLTHTSLLTLELQELIQLRHAVLES